jgi:hypothetical protein
MTRMTPGEVTAVTILFGYPSGKEEQPPQGVVLALETIASQAHNRLQTVVSELSVRRQRPSAYQDAPR